MDVETLVTVGVDTHTDVHVAAVLDPAGRPLETASFPATTRGYMHVGVSVHADRHDHFAVHTTPLPMIKHNNGLTGVQQRRTAQGRGTKPQALIRSPRHAHRGTAVTPDQPDDGSDSRHHAGDN